MNYKIGIDIGASKIMGIIWNGKKITQSIKIKTSKNKRKFLSDMLELTATLIDIAGVKNVSGIGIAVAGILDKKGKMLESPNMKFLNGVNLKEIGAKKFKKQTRIINDAKAFLLYEMKHGVAQGRKNAVVITLGSGVGGAIEVNDKILFGAHGSAGEIGHTIIQLKTKNTKLKTIRLENLAAAKNLKRGYRRMGEALGIGLANIVNMLDPEIIVIGGGLASVGNKILFPAKRTMKKYIISPKAKNIRVVIEKNYEFASAIGATLL